MKKFLFFFLFVSLSSLVLADVGGELVNANGDTIVLKFDPLTYSYADGTSTNQNMFLRLTSNDSLNDLDNKHLNLFYHVGDKAVSITHYSKNIEASDNNQLLDLDLSSGKAFFPGVLSVAISDNTGFTSPGTNYYMLNEVTGFLEGNYKLEINSNDDNVAVKVSEIISNTGSIILTTTERIIVGTMGSGGEIVDTKVTGLGGVVYLSNPGGDFEFIVNGIVIAEDDITIDDGIDVPEEPVTPSGGSSASGSNNLKYACNDGEDNDGDSLVDYPEDPGCLFPKDDTEENPGPLEVQYIEVWNYEEIPAEVEIPEEPSTDTASQLPTGSDASSENEFGTPQEQSPAIVSSETGQNEPNMINAMTSFAKENGVLVASILASLGFIGTAGYLFVRPRKIPLKTSSSGTTQNVNVEPSVDQNLKQLGEYIDQELSTGRNLHDLKQELKHSGWEDRVIDHFLK